ncbi:hypothetical protein CANINC_003612 [Pichia inconspicua]|uniref:Uncharacterized protein n=1 Tax=Pichia inconspicua TaxID=52247 RepID=A0A4T0WY83_9ASCO|nr:hypothetical protein CANINC_003612 [[Candida] inconspicua]
MQRLSTRHSYGTFTRCFSLSRIRLKELPRPSQTYMSDIGVQPTPLTEAEIAEKEVADIDLPQATLDERAEIKKAMKKRSLRMTFWQLFLVTLLSSSTLNVMREKNLREELEDNYKKKFKVLERLIQEANEGLITVEEAREQLKVWNERFVDVFELTPVIVDGPEGIDKRRLILTFKKMRGDSVTPDDLDEVIFNESKDEISKSNEQLHTFL